jgi:hypothetical protein
LSAIIGLPVLKTQTPCFFCRGEELRQGHLLAFDEKIEGVAGAQVQLLPDGFGQDYTVSFVESDYALHCAS